MSGRRSTPNKCTANNNRPPLCLYHFALIAGLSIVLLQSIVPVAAVKGDPNVLPPPRLQPQCPFTFELKEDRDFNVFCVEVATGYSSLVGIMPAVKWTNARYQCNGKAYPVSDVRIKCRVEIQDCRNAADRLAAQSQKMYPQSEPQSRHVRSRVDVKAMKKGVDDQLKALSHELEQYENLQSLVGLEARPNPPHRISSVGKTTEHMRRTTTGVSSSEQPEKVNRSTVQLTKKASSKTSKDLKNALEELEVAIKEM